MAENNAQIAPQKKYAVDNKDIEQLISQLQAKQEKGLKFPPNYSVSNAMNGAYLMLKQAEDKNGKPLLEVCTRDSVMNSLVIMATLGLNPLKKQCYFIAMGSKCTLMQSYFGTQTVLKRIANVVGEPQARVIYKGDEFEYEIDVETGEQRITKHKTSLERIGSEIVGAYAIIRTDKAHIVEIKNMAQIRKSWAMGAARGNSKAHNDFAEDMAKKTVLTAASKLLINSSDDSTLSDEVIESLNEVDDNDIIDATAVEIKAEIEEKANIKEFKASPKKEPKKEIPKDINPSLDDQISLDPGF
ncbi:recombinase RecT [Lachnospiraceae bacterium ZAX-1]